MITSINEFKLINENLNYQSDDIVELKGYDFTQLFNVVNKECFDNKLTIIPFKLVNSKSFTASYNYTINRTTRQVSNQQFKFSTVFKINFQKLKNIMAHEMIHYYLRAIGDRDKSHHGYAFKHEMYRINNLGLGYKVTLKDDEPGELHDDILDKKTTEKIFVTFEKSDRRGYALIPIKMFNKNDLIKHAGYFKYTNINVYKTTSPRTKPLRSGKNYYMIKPEFDYLLDDVFNDFENTTFLYSIEN